jgi:hypothetical protein
MANQFKSGDDAAGYLFDVALRKGKAAAEREYDRLSKSIPEDQRDAFRDSINNIYDQKKLRENEGLGAAKVQRYREKAAKHMSVDYDKEFGAKPTPKPAPKPATKEAPKAAPKPVERDSFMGAAAPKPAANKPPMEQLKAPRPTESRVPVKPAAPKPETPKPAAPFSARGVSNFLGITADKPAPGSRPSIGGGAMLDLKGFPDLKQKPTGKAPK